MGFYDPYIYGVPRKEMKKSMYKQVYEFVLEYAEEHGTTRGAFSLCARNFYPELYSKDPRKAIKLVYEHYRYARKRFWNKVFGNSGAGFGTNLEDNINESIEYNMGYFVNNHGGKIDEPKFFKDSKFNRKLFEFKKIVYAILQDLIRPKSTLKSYVERIISDPRIKKILDNGDKIWYNGKSYIKINKEQAALLYIVVHKIYTMHYGIGNKPEKLIKKYLKVTGYAPKDLEKEIKQLIPMFYDWLLCL